MVKQHTEAVPEKIISPTHPAPVGTGPTGKTITPVPTGTSHPGSKPTNISEGESRSALVGALTVIPVEAAERLAELPISFPVMNRQMVDYFNNIARPEDVVLIPEAYLNLLPLVENGKTKVGFASWEDAEIKLPGILKQVDVVGYNPEHWDRTPDQEQEDLPGTVNHAAIFTKKHALLLMISPDRRFSSEQLDLLAPSADMVGLQAQRLQGDPKEFSLWAHNMISVARKSNPQVEVYVQVSTTQGSADEMLAAILTVAMEIDGILIWTHPASFDTLQEFITLIRPEN